jgi:hypothetical protein
MLYSKSTGGFYCQEINGSNIPADAIEIPDEIYSGLFEAQSNGEVIVADADGQPIAITRAPSIPQSVSPLQARKALKQQSMLLTVQAAVDAANEDTQMAWEYATSFDRQSPFVLGMASVLGWTELELDGLFVLAATL